MLKIFCLLILASSATAQVMEHSVTDGKESRGAQSRSVGYEEQISVSALLWPTLLQFTAGPGVAGVGEAAEAEFEALIKKKDRTDAEVKKVAGYTLISVLSQIGCKRVYEGGVYAYSHVYENTRLPSVHAAIGIKSEDPESVMLPNLTAYTSDWSESMYGKALNANTVMTCMRAAAAMMSSAAQRLANSASVTTDKLSGDRVLVVDNLQQRAREALLLSFLNSAGAGLNNDRLAEVCRVPTPNGLIANKTIVLCPPFEYDQAERRLKKGSVTLLDEQTLYGVRIVFANAVRSERSTARYKRNDVNGKAKVIN